MLELITRFARVFWRALDCINYAVALARGWVVDLICGPEPPTPADEQREADHEHLRKAFPGVDFDGAMAVHKERQAQAETTPITSPLGV